MWQFCREEQGRAKKLRQIEENHIQVSVMVIVKSVYSSPSFLPSTFPNYLSLPHLQAHSAPRKDMALGVLLHHTNLCLPQLTAAKGFRVNPAQWLLLLEIKRTQEGPNENCS